MSSDKTRKFWTTISHDQASVDRAEQIVSEGLKASPVTMIPEET